MSEIKVNDEIIRTDLITEKKISTKNTKITYKKDGIEVHNDQNNNYNYSTIYFNDITDSSNYFNLKEVLKKELRKYLTPNINDSYLIIGLGNINSTPDSLGPKTINKVLVTRYLFNNGDVSKKYSNVAAYRPDVSGNTGIESLTIIKSIINKIKPSKVIIIDSLKANNLLRLVKTIQITDRGINPGSGILNDRGEISKKTMRTPIIAIGIPTVVDIQTLTNDYKSPNFMVTPTNIDFVIERLSQLLATSINEILHKALFDK